jgi:hypothetical protein
MGKTQDQAAGPAGPTGLFTGMLTEEQLSQPEPQALLPDPRWPGHKDHLRQPTAGTRRPGVAGPDGDRPKGCKVMVEANQFGPNSQPRKRALKLCAIMCYAILARGKMHCKVIDDRQRRAVLER